MSWIARSGLAIDIALAVFAGIALFGLATMSRPHRRRRRYERMLDEQLSEVDRWRR